MKVAGAAAAQGCIYVAWMAVLGMACSAFLAPAASAQTLDQQYEFFLGGHCQNLNFARDANDQILPGQVTGKLLAFCNGPPLVGAPSESSTAGGGAGAGEGRGEGAQEDAALRRRRDRMRDEANGKTAAPDLDLDIGSYGRTSAFLSLEYLRENQKTTEFEAGRHSNGADGTLGVDHRFGTQGLAGLALKYHHQWGEIVSGGTFTVQGEGIWAYGSWWPVEQLFVDLAAGYDLRRIDTERLVSRTTTNENPEGNVSFFNPGPALAGSNTNSREGGAELRSGYDFSLSSFNIGPRAALTFKRTRVDAYTESGPTPMILAFDAQSATSLRSLVGLQTSRAFTPGGVVLLPQLNADWVHEYRDNQRLISARFAEDLRPSPSILSFLNQAPDRDWFDIRAAVSAVFTHGVSAFAALEGMAGHSYLERYRASIGLRVEL